MGSFRTRIESEPRHQKREAEQRSADEPGRLRAGRNGASRADEIGQLPVDAAGTSSADRDAHRLRNGLIWTAALARLELRILFEETLARFPDMELAGPPVCAESAFINQLKTLPVRLRPA
ncbi:MAG: hypothetical protein JO181_19980 [Solirubrobacterales bacterium]|nr:hypothetical protein [Solirubrobacterales bacterium]